jgi:hypothetical protein
VFEVKKRVLLFILGLMLFFIGDFFFKTRGFWSFLSPYLKKKLEKFLDSMSWSSHCFPLWQNFLPWQQNKIQYNWFKKKIWKKSTQVAIF